MAAGPGRTATMAGPSASGARMAPYQVPTRRRLSSSTSSGSSRSSTVQGAGDLPPGDLVDDMETSSSVSGGVESQIIGNRQARAPLHGLSQTPRAVRRRTQRAQTDPLERVLAELRESVRTDAANIAVLQETEASMARHGGILVEQGAQQLALCTQMVQLLQQLVQRGMQGQGEGGSD